ncbi:40S ribosomal protein S5-1 [Hordeum vulgare]|nr:40S ribosomal protein S5-1 [Hordeum vulgare]
MRDWVLHTRDVQGIKKMGTVEARLEALEQEVFRCQGMVECGLSANQTMITELTRDLKVDGKHLEDIDFTLNDQVNFLQGQLFDLQNKSLSMKQGIKV